MLMAMLILNEARMLLYQISESLLLISVYRLEVETISLTLALCFIARAAIRGRLCLIFNFPFKY